MVLYRKQKYIDYAVNAIQKLKRENGLTISEIVKYIMLTNEKTSRFRPLFAKVKASTNLGISNGLLWRHHYRIQLRSDDDAMSSRDGSDTSDGDSGSEYYEDEMSSVGTTDNEAGSSSDESERHMRRKTAPIKQANKGQLNSRRRAGVNRRLVVASSNESKRRKRKTAPVKRADKKQMMPRTRAELKRRLVEASSDDETEYDSDEDTSNKKRKVVQRKSRQNRTSTRKCALPPRSKSSPVKRRCDSGRSKASYKNDKVKVEDNSTKKQLPLAKKILTAQDVGKGGNKAKKRKTSTEAEECGSDSRRKIKEEVGEDRQPVAGTSGARAERKGKWEVKKEKVEEENNYQDGGGNEASRSTEKVKVEIGEELKVTKDVEKAQEEYDFYT